MTLKSKLLLMLSMFRGENICQTLTANMGTFPDRVPIILDDYGIRKITPYECLALEGFPKEFRFPKIPMNSAYKQCGNSVVVPVIKRIAENIKKFLKKIKKRGGLVYGRFN